jgi:Protein of unknown function (DUF1186)/SEC-C motif
MRALCTTKYIYRFYMHIDEILNCFNNPNGQFPKAALTAALEQQAEITPYLLAIIKNVAHHHESISTDNMDYTFALYLLSKFKEKQALPYILAIAALPGTVPEDLLGDCITEALSRFIVSTFNDDLASIKAVIENPKLNEWSRNAALKSLLGLVALGHLRREELIVYLRSLFHSNLADDEEFTTRLVDVASDLYPEELMDEINIAFDQDKINIDCIDRQWVEESLKQGKEACLAKYVYNDKFHSPIDDVEEDMNWMVAFNGSWDKRSYENFIPETSITYIRSAPKIGRNELCPCGSGKKFKKCCLN